MTQQPLDNELKLYVVGVPTGDHTRWGDFWSEYVLVLASSEDEANQLTESTRAIEVEMAKPGVLCQQVIRNPV